MVVLGALLLKPPTDYELDHAAHFASKVWAFVECLSLRIYCMGYRLTLGRSIYYFERKSCLVR